MASISRTSTRLADSRQLNEAIDLLRLLGGVEIAEKRPECYCANKLIFQLLFKSTAPVE